MVKTHLFVALYEGETVANAKVVGASADAHLVAEAVRKTGAKYDLLPGGTTVTLISRFRRLLRGCRAFVFGAPRG